MLSEERPVPTRLRGWNRVIGQRRVKELLRRAIQTDQVAHAYIFIGPEGVGTDALALEFARVLNCEPGGTEACDQCASCRQMDILQHSNVRLVMPLPVGKNEKQGDDPIEVLTDDQIASVRGAIAAKAKDPYASIEIPRATSIKINSIRAIKREAALSRPERGRNIFVILRAEEMGADASNSLLKTLEEPPGDTVLLLTTMDRDALLPTIVSRCQQIQCERLSDDDLEEALTLRDGLEESLAHVVAQMAGGSYTAARDIVSSDVRSRRAEAVNFLRLVLGKQRIQMIQEVERLASDNDRPAMERWLRLLGGWLRDALVLREGRSVHAAAEDLQALQSFTSRFSVADLSGAVLRVERAIADLDKNLYLLLILTTLAMDLRRLIAEPGRE